MHFEILIEDISGQRALELLLPKMIGPEHSYRVIAYKGIGHLPGKLKGKSDAAARILLDRLPSLLNGYGKTFRHYPPEQQAVLIVVCDLDGRCLKGLRDALHGVLEQVSVRPVVHFCIAVQEGEAWYLGDVAAIKAAYPRMKGLTPPRLDPDQIRHSWEYLAEAIYSGGAKELVKKGSHAIGAEKFHWAEQICPHMVPEENQSGSFQYFRRTLISLSQ